MLGTELAYVRERLATLDPAQRTVVAKAIGLNPKTLRRIASGETQYGRTDTIGKIAMHFRTQQKRGRAT